MNSDRPDGVEEDDVSLPSVSAGHILPSAVVALIIAAWAFTEMIPISYSVASTVPAAARGQYHWYHWRDFPSVNLRAVGLALPHLWALLAGVALMGFAVMPRRHWAMLIWPATILLLAGLHAVYLSSLQVLSLVHELGGDVWAMWKIILRDAGVLAVTDLIFLSVWWRWRVPHRHSASEDRFPLELPCCLGAWLCLSWFSWLAWTFGGEHLRFTVGLSHKPPDTFEWLYASPLPALVLFVLQASELRRRRARLIAARGADQRRRSIESDPAAHGSPGP